MLKILIGQIKQYKRDTILTPLFMVGEVLMEVMIPFITARIIDRGITAGSMENIVRYGGLMVVMAFASLFFGVMSGRCAARYAKNAKVSVRFG